MFLWALIIDALAPVFAGRRNLLAALKVAVFAATPALLAGILSLLPALSVLQILAALYGLYLLFRGLPVLMQSPPAKALGYTALTVACGIGVGIVLGGLMMVLRLTPFVGQGPLMAGGASDAVVQSASAGDAGSIAAGIVAAGKAAAAAASAEPAAPTTSHSETSADDRQAGAAAAAGIAALGAFVGGGKAHVATVDFRSLEALLPATLAARTRTDVHGEKSNAAGLGMSEAEGSYGAAGDELRVKITDMGNARGVLALGKLAFSIESENDTGYEKNVTLGGAKIHEKWTATSKTSELTTFVGDRFLVEVNGAGVAMPDAERALTTLDLNRLATLPN